MFPSTIVSMLAAACLFSSAYAMPIQSGNGLAVVAASHRGRALADPLGELVAHQHGGPQDDIHIPRDVASLTTAYAAIDNAKGQVAVLVVQLQSAVTVADITDILVQIKAILVEVEASVSVSIAAAVAADASALAIKLAALLEGLPAELIVILKSADADVHAAVSGVLAIVGQLVVTVEAVVPGVAALLANILVGVQGLLSIVGATSILAFVHIIV